MLEYLYLSADDVICLHGKAIAHAGGDSTLLDRGKLESAVAQPKTAFDGVEVHPDLASKAAAYLYFVVKAHAFADGNKRASVLAAIVFLDINGYEFSAETDEFEQLVLDTVLNKVTREDIAAFFQDRMKPRKADS